MDRRTAIKLTATLPVALTWTDSEARDAGRLAHAARHQAAQSGQAYQPKFFTPDEWRTVRVLVDMIIPRDERSGSATDAAVPEFMDFIMTDQPGRQTAMRGGLRWIDNECVARFGKKFVDCAESERAALLDDLAWPKRAKPEHSHGVTFFTSFRDLTAAGFWSSKMGVEDLQYMGNTYVTEWKGCPEPALRKLGVSYED